VKGIKSRNEENDYRNRRYQELRDKILYEKEQKDIQNEKVRKAKLNEFLGKQVLT
jgi:hypothetical protein